MTEHEPRPSLSFGELLRANVRLLALVVVYVALAYAGWRGLVWLFPDVAWLQPKGS